MKQQFCRAEVPTQCRYGQPWQSEEARCPERSLTPLAWPQFWLCLVFWTWPSPALGETFMRKGLWGMQPFHTQMQRQPPYKYCTLAAFQTVCTSNCRPPALYLFCVLETGSCDCSPVVQHSLAWTRTQSLLNSVVNHQGSFQPSTFPTADAAGAAQRWWCT